MRLNFTLKTVVSENQARVYFKQPITIPRDAEVNVYWATISYAPQADYLTEGVEIYTDLPIKHYSNYITAELTTGDIQAGASYPILLAIPPQTQAQLDADDPSSLPTVALQTYEPKVPVKHDMKNQEQQINSINFWFHDLINERRPVSAIEEMVISFCIKTCECDKKKNEGSY